LHFRVRARESVRCSQKAISLRACPRDNMTFAFARESFSPLTQPPESIFSG
jgi:hypothetical protein